MFALAWLACTAARPPVPVTAPPSDALTSCHEGTEGCDPYIEGLDSGGEFARRRAAVLRHLRCRNGDVESCVWWVDRQRELRSAFPRHWGPEAARELCALAPGRCVDATGVPTGVADLGVRPGLFHAWSVGDRELVVAQGTTLVVWDGIGEPVRTPLTEQPLDAGQPPMVGALSISDGTLRAAIFPRGLARPSRGGVPQIPVLIGRRIKWVGSGVRICAPFGDADPEGFVATVGDARGCPSPLRNAPRARFDWSGREIERVEGLASGMDGAWRLNPIDPPPAQGRRATIDGDMVYVREADGTDVIPPIEVGRSSELQAAMISGDGSRVFVLAYPGQLYAYHLDPDPQRGEAVAMPTPTDDWVRRGGFGDTGRLTGRLPVLGDANDARGTARVASLTRLGDAPAFVVEVRADRDGRFAVDVPYGEYEVTGEGFRGAVEVFADRAIVENTELLADADLEPGDALHWWPAGGPIRSEEPVTMTVTPPAAIDRADGTRAATSIWGDWIDVEPAIQRAFEVRWDTGEPIVGATVLQEGLAGELQVAAGRAVADEEGRGWVVMSSKPTSLRVDGLEAPPTWPIEPELRYDELRWTVPRSSLRILGLKPGQSATLSHDTRDLQFTFVPDGEGWLVRRNDEAPARPQASPRLTHVPPGSWTLIAWDPAGRASRTQVALETGREAIARPDWKGAGSVQIVVVDPAGRRVPGARIDVVTGLSQALDGFRVETDELGQVLVETLPPGPVVLRVIDHATRYRALVEVDVEPRRTSPVLVEVRVPPDLADHPGIEFGQACVVRNPGDLRGPLDASDRVLEIGERSTDGWSPEACMAAFQDGDGTRSALVRGARGQRNVAFPGPPRCSTSGTCVQTTRSGEKVLRRGPI